MMDSMFTTRHLEENIRSKFMDKIQMLQTNYKKIIAPKCINIIDGSLFAHLKDQDILQAAVSILHKEISNSKKLKLPDNLNSQ